MPASQGQIPSRLAESKRFLVMSKSCFRLPGSYRRAIKRADLLPLAWRNTQRDTVHRARHQAKPTPRAFLRQHRMHDLRCPQNRVDRADLYAFGAPDTNSFVDDGNGARGFDAVFGVQRLVFAAQQRGERADAGFAAGRALVNVGFADGDGFGVGAAAGVVALAALGLRQQGVDAVGERDDGCGRRRHELVQREREQCGE